jgi:hypothetical protein
VRHTCGRKERCIGLMEKPAGKSQSRIPKHRQKDNVERSERKRLDGQRVEKYFLTYTVINITIL